jgi:uncharacterized protein with PIN domain
VRPIEDYRFIVDHNAGKLVRWLRLMGYDTRFFTGGDDREIVAIALAEARIILTRDTGIARRKVATSGRLRVILFRCDVPERQLRQVISSLNLNTSFRPFSLCLECNQELVPVEKDHLSGRVPPYVYRTQRQFMECPGCRRIYWRGTHWRAMTAWLDKLDEG